MHPLNLDRSQIGKWGLIDKAAIATARDVAT